MAIREYQIRTKILRYLNSLPNAWFEISYPGSPTGRPDITGALNGRYVAVEVKRNKYNHARKHQIYYHKQMRKGGAFVIREAISVDQVKKELRDWLMEQCLPGNVATPSMIAAASIKVSKEMGEKI